MAISQIDQKGLAEFVLGLSGEGLGCREIAKRLEQEKGLKMAHTSVNKWLKAVRTERAEDTKALVQENIKGTVPRDLEILTETRDQLNNYRQGMDEDGNPIQIKISERLMCIDRLNKVIDTRLKYSGAEEKEDGGYIFDWVKHNG